MDGHNAYTSEHKVEPYHKISGPEKFKMYYHLLDAIRRFVAHLPSHESGV
jgi:hypothetical protein